MAVIGSSLGGFYATVVAERTGCRAVLLNPADRAGARPRRATSASTTAWHSDERFFFRAEYVDELRALAPPAPLTAPGALLRGHRQGRRGAVWREMSGALRRLAACALIEGSDHALSDFDDHLPEVLGFLGL